MSTIPAPARYASPVDLAAYGPYRSASRPGDRRPRLRFTGRLTADGSSGFQAEPGRYHLYAGWFCPWSQRVVLQVVVNGLSDVIGVSYVDDARDGRGWAFRQTHGPDPVNGFTLLREAYEATEPGFDGHISVPVLWDTRYRPGGQQRLPEHRSGHRHPVRRLPLARHRHLPAADRAEIEELDSWIGPAVNQGLGRAAGDGPAAGRARADLLAAFDLLDDLLVDRSFLVGHGLTEADLRLWVSLARYDVQANAAGRIGPPLSAWPHLSRYAAWLAELPAFRATTRWASFSRPRRPHHPVGLPDRRRRNQVDDPAAAPRRRPRRRRLAPRRLAAAHGPARRAAHRRLLGRPGPARRAGPARLRHHRGRPGLQTSRPTRPARRPDRPGPRPARRGADRRPGRAADQPHRAGPDRHRRPTPSRSTCPRPSPPWTTSRTGRAGWRVAGLRRAGGGRALRPPHDPATRTCVGDDPAARRLVRDLFDEAGDAVEVVRRLWDSWEDDAEIRDVATGRFVDRDKLHYIDFEGRWFSVRGPSITPRPPQGQPRRRRPGRTPRCRGRFAAPLRRRRLRDTRTTTPQAAAARRRDRRRPARRPAGTASTTCSPTWSSCSTPTRERGPGAAGHSCEAGPGGRTPATPRSSSAPPQGLADLLLARADGRADRLPAAAGRAAARPRRRSSTRWCPSCSAAGCFRTAYEAGTLRGLLGLPARQPLRAAT